MHDEVKDAWLEWSPMIWRGPPGKAPSKGVQKEAQKGESRLARFFHHEDKDEGEAEEDAEPNKDANQEAAHEEKRHGFFHDLFHKDHADKKTDD